MPFAYLGSQPVGKSDEYRQWSATNIANPLARFGRRRACEFPQVVDGKKRRRFPVKVAMHSASPRRVGERHQRIALVVPLGRSQANGSPRRARLREEKKPTRREAGAEMTGAVDSCVGANDGIYVTDG
jgi:hypothetical protein